MGRLQKLQSHSCLTMALQFLLLSHSYLTMALQFLLLSHSSLTMALQFLLLSHSCITMALQFLLLSHSCVTMELQFLLLSHSALTMALISSHSVPECGFEGLKTYQAPAHIWDLPRWWKTLLLINKIIHMRTCGLSHQIMGPTTVKVAKTGLMRKIANLQLEVP